MYDFVLSNPTQVFFGSEQRKKLAETVHSCGNKVLLVYGGGSIRRSGLYDEVTKGLHEAGVQVVDFGGVSANPRNTLVNDGARACRKEHVDVVLAIGGGSVIDCAKAIAVASCYEGDCWDLITRKAPVTGALPIVAVATVTGTGSEMNNSCVISNWEQHEKRGFSHPLLQPRAAFLDPALCYTVGAFQTACGCADILSHVLDTAYLVNGDRMEMLCQVMEAVCRTVVHYGPIAVRQPQNYEARANLMWASTWALNGFLKNGVRQLAACHAIEHELSALYDINHGLGMAILLPRWMRSMLDAEAAPCYARLGRNVFYLSPELDDKKCAALMLERLEQFLYEDLSLPSALRQAGVGEDQFANMAERICWGGELPGYRKLKPIDVENIFKMCR